MKRFLLSSMLVFLILQLLAQNNSPTNIKSISLIDVSKPTDNNLIKSDFSGITPMPKTEPQINIYPNPAIGYITVDATGMLCNLYYEIYDILGRNISSGIIKCTSSNQLNISGLDDGIYIINVSDGKNKFSRKFIKQ